jgi:exodeoxyribonuclease III
MTRFQVATFNANSIRVRLPQILAWLEREQPDLLGIQETKVRDEEFPREQLEEAGWHVAYRGQTSHSGVALISREPLEQVEFGFDDGSHPARLARTEVHGVHVLCSYVPQGKTIDHEDYQLKLSWLDRIRHLLEADYAPQDLVLWMGDLNVAPEPIDIYDPKRHADHVDFHIDVREKLAKVCSWGLVDLFRWHHPDEPGHYTYWDYRARNPVSEGKGWRVDHILVTEPLAERSTDVWIDVDARMAERPSDHTFLVGTFDL